MSDPYDSLSAFRSTSGQPGEAVDDEQPAETSGNQSQLQGAPDPKRPHTDLCAVLSAVFGVFGLLWLGCLFAPVAVVLGVVSHFRLKDNRHLTGHAWKNLGLITGLVMSIYAIYMVNEAASSIEKAGEALQQIPAQIEAGQNNLVDGIKISEEKNERDEFGSSYLTGVITNGNSKPVSVAVEYDLYDKSGARIGTASDVIDDLAPGEKWRFKAGILYPDAANRGEARISAY